ncbi:uncharacterized protein LODBEIA_P37390 [Lodderomyces beijingensis]|uniref:VHS domain-containing protein n=1 Tax=Lodderomyces beijingensis TaxID=1775926 RepID=A0ABP0ZQQ1_9ASCO
MPIFNEKPFTSITVKINQLCQAGRNEEIDDTLELHLSNLIELIKVQPQSGASEAARAIRKKIKYGGAVEEQLRALNILELLLLNSGHKIGPIIARDDKLVEVLKGVISGHGRTGTGGGYGPKVVKRAMNMAIGWKSEFDGLDGYKYMQQLHKAIPKKQRILESSSSRRDKDRRERSQSDSDNDSDDGIDPYDDDFALSEPKSKRETRSSQARSPKAPPPRPTTASPYSVNSKDRSRREEEKTKKKQKKNKRSKNGIIYADEQYGIPQINYKKEAPKIEKLLSDANAQCIQLDNKLQHVVSPGNDAATLEIFEACKQSRRKVLKYLQFVGAGDPTGKSREVVEMDEKYLARLIRANEDLVETFKKFDTRAGRHLNTAPDVDDGDGEEWSESDESYYSSEEEEESIIGDDSIASRLQAATMDEPKRAAPPPPPTTITTTTNSGDKSLQSGFQAKPKLDKTETNDSFGGDPFGDTNEV